MAKKNRKKVKLPRNGSIILAIAAFALVCVFFVFYFGQNGDIKDRENTLESKKAQVAQQEEKNAELEQMLESSDLDAFVEKRARDEDLGYAYPDERVYYDMGADD